MYIARFLLVLTASLALPTATSANDRSTLEPRLEQLAQDLERARKEAHIPGMSIAVVRDDEVVWARGFGLADVDGKREADEQTIFGAGSTTKAFTATLAGMLHDDGLVAWDDPVAEHLPYFRLQVRSDDEDAECTLRDLLSHRHGFARMGILVMGTRASREDVLRTAAGAEPWDTFRQGFHYCNVAYLAAGESLGNAAGSSWDELMGERIFGPLGMTSSTVSVPAAQADERMALGYRWEPALERLERADMIDLGVIGPAGAVNSNVLDMAQWLRLQIGQGEVDGRRLISRERLADTWAPQIDMGDGGSYGLGWMLREYEGRRVVEHGGNVDGFSAEVAFLPEERLGFVLLMNLSAAPLREASLELVFDALLGDQDGVTIAADGAESIDAIALEEYAGTYIANFASFRDAEFEVLVDDGRLMLEAPGQPRTALEAPDHDGRWKATSMGNGAVTFERDADGGLVGLTVHTGGFQFDVPRKGVEIAPEVPAAELEGYVGTYIRAEGGKRVKVLIDNGRLTLEDKGNRLAFETPDANGWASLRAREEQGAAFKVDAEGTAESFVFHGNAGKKLFRRQTDSGITGLPTVDELLALRDTDARVAALKADAGSRMEGEVWVAQAGLRGAITIFTRGLDRYADHMDFGKFGRISTVVKGYEASSYSALRGIDKLEGRELAQAMVGHPASVDGDWRAYFDHVEVLRSETLDERPVHVLRLRKSGLPSRTYWVDAETGDVLRTKHIYLQDSVQLPVTTTYSRFEDFDGQRRAMRVESENPASGRMVLSFGRPESGLELADDVFTLTEAESKD